MYVYLRTVPLNAGSIFAQIMTMQERQTLVWATEIKKENWG